MLQGVVRSNVRGSDQCDNDTPETLTVLDGDQSALKRVIQVVLWLLARREPQAALQPATVARIALQERG
jgi:hypothetical protein